MNVTESLTIDAPSEIVLSVVGDPAQAPNWAPGFATSIEPEGDLWRVHNDAGELIVRYRVDPELGVVDILDPQSGHGLFTRALANGDGCELTFTMFLPAGEIADTQRAIFVTELEAVRRMCEQG